MMERLATLVRNALGPEKVADQSTRARGLQLATAVLLVEVARADYADDILEERAIRTTLRDFFSLGSGEIDLLMEQSWATADDAVDLQQFTRLLNEQLSAGEKMQVIEMLWRVALADENLDKHEDHLIRKIAGLLYVPHRDMIRARNKVRDAS